MKASPFALAISLAAESSLAQPTPRSEYFSVRGGGSTEKFLDPRRPSSSSCSPRTSISSEGPDRR